MTPDQYARTKHELAALPLRIRRAIKAAGALDAAVQAHGTDELQETLTPLLHELIESVDAFDHTKVPKAERYVEEVNLENLGVYVIDWYPPEAEFPNSNHVQPARIFFSLAEFMQVTGLTGKSILRATTGGRWRDIRKPITDPHVSPAFAYTGKARIRRFTYTDQSIEELTELGFGDRMDEIVNVWNKRSPMWIATPYLEYMREQREQESKPKS